MAARVAAFHLDGQRIAVHFTAYLLRKQELAMEDTTQDTELASMMKVFDALKNESQDAQKRIVAWVTDRLGIVGPLARVPEKAVQNGGADAAVHAAPEFATFAELHNACSPTTYAEHANVAGYWLQVQMGQEMFSGQAVNKELQNLGHALVNITDAFNQLKDKKPSLVIQVKKSGKSQQARKLYKLSQAGIDAVRAMIQRGAGVA